MRVVRPSALGKVTGSGGTGAMLGCACAEARDKVNAAIRTVAATAPGHALIRTASAKPVALRRFELRPMLLALLAKQLGFGLALSHRKGRGGRAAALLFLVPVGLRLLLLLVASHLTLGH